MAHEKTLLMVKPDGVKARLTGEVIRRVEMKGLHISAIKKFKFDRHLAEKFYAVHKSKPFFEDLVNFITSGEVVALVVEGEAAVSVVRRLIGPTNASEAPPGTIRGDFANSVQENVVHASDSLSSAEYEIGLLF
ncbi:nucleoside-diphosphate kinase [Candidatus Marsarchaeota G2 archaeon OSP_D]|jgi:nucleoside diphosphate kinase (EC 2.7.4.6)|uniref:Nucleoside diphosphate kinase n=5 Tax=Candidatus Marsarchaeota group 2 TaxID=2203771 RepID=A0A2R6CEM6_9ARCH|nr:MAG: nucleoside-diphosphate kinase [Candidatus Marsarchaeota G2 archaeon OSP_D]PSN96779.1 MAG: nucleoside-diphosphate kinase [Candidatus Marsarchaeota G2 archaeon ECH_B_2]PSO01348.1 MAG: nucleoside-diphosphate kinase [Candidatus Marsarchaeota G2 archaeon ECH_B_3]PSO03480.1 MAG: nucleoside-diphosphate kinase [Candidatus Marsarchaeota G2 archaeon ECH_B_1]PSO09357.1 MAG: nucleoside-diphosphate kinase [Candidatus Marsarchaeota G2 archaeon BE_D]